MNLLSSRLVIDKSCRFHAQIIFITKAGWNTSIKFTSKFVFNEQAHFIFVPLDSRHMTILYELVL